MDEPWDDDAPWAEDSRTMEFDPGAIPGRVEREHYLVVVSGNEPGRRIRLTGDPLEFGRRGGADIRFEDPKVSTRHCSVRLDSDGTVVSDLKSTNGTFVDGARIDDEQPLPVGSVLQIGSQQLKHEMLTPAEVRRTEEREGDLQDAAAYVRSLLPPPLDHGPVRTDWIYAPSATLGGDAFGYRAMPDGRFGIYLLDASGHGSGPALHSVSVLNVLNQESLPDTDFARPETVMERLNRVFGMDDHGGMYFTCWYGVYDPGSRRIRYASAGHPPALLVSADRRSARRLQTPNPGVGLMPEARFSADEVDVPPGDALYIYSDGAFEIEVKDEDRDWTLEECLATIAAPRVSGMPEAKRIHRHVLDVAGVRALSDDFSILIATFP